MSLARVAVVLALSAMDMTVNARAERLIAGFGCVPPLHYRDAAGRPIGFVIDVINEAAKREHVEIQWRRVGGSNDIERALQQGLIDLFPAGIDTERRRALFSVSAPWWSEDLSILARGDKPLGSRGDWRGSRLVLTSPTYMAKARVMFPASSLVLPDQYDARGGPESSVAVVCAGQADGALMAHVEVDEVLVDRPAVCNAVKLQVIETPGSLDLSVIARWEKALFGQRLRRRLDELALDGTMGRIAGRYPRIPARSAVALAETVRTRYQHTVLLVALCAAIALVVVAALLLLRQMRIQRALRTSLREQKETETSLRLRTEELSASNEELQAFAYTVSHDFQEPLRMVALYSELFERRYPPTCDDGRVYLEFMRSGARRMQDMLSSLLVYSRVGRTDNPRKTVNVSEIVANVLRDLEYQIASTGAQISVGPMPTVIAWPDRLNQVFHHLISNSLKYRRVGVTPVVELSAVESAGEWVFAVRDNGIGFKAEYAERIFGVFKRLHGRDEYGGTGLGLAIARRVVERHGGRIRAEGRPNEGSTFFFVLPAATANATAVEPRTPGGGQLSPVA